MIAIQRVLCPIDFSDISRRALEHATALARSQGASLLALHVVPFAAPLPMAPAPVYPAATLPPSPQVRRSMLEELERAVEPARRRGVDVETIIREGEAVAAILNEAQRLPIDMVVMGSHGVGGFERLVMGSVAEKVLRKAPCPVLTVGPPADEKAREPVRHRRILCPVDFSQTSLRALEYAMSVAEDPRCGLTLLHVHEEIPYPFLPFERAIEGADSEKAVLETIEGRLRTLLPENVGDFCTPAVSARRGRPHETILEVAREEASDTIVLGVHGRGLLERLLLGSVTSQVVRSAPCPVLTVRATARPPAARAEGERGAAGEPQAEVSSR